MTLNSQTRSPLRADHARELSNIGKRAARYWVLAETVSIASSYDAAGHAAVATFQLGATSTSGRMMVSLLARTEPAIRVHAGEALAV